MHQLAMLAGKAALVIKEAEVNENGPLYVKIKGRKSGLITWLLTLLGIDSTTTFEVYEDRIEFSEGSLSGRIKEMIPLTTVCNLGTGYMKPILWLVWAFLFLIASFFCLANNSAGMMLFFLILTAGAVFLYFFRKSMLLYAIPNSGSGAMIIFKRSLIENVNISEEDAYRIISLISKLVEKNKAR